MDADSFLNSMFFLFIPLSSIQEITSLTTNVPLWVGAGTISFMHILPIVLLLLTFLILSGFFSGSETSLFSLNKMQLSHMANRHPRLSRFVFKLLESPNELYTSILVGNTLVNIGAALCSGIITERLLGGYPVISFIAGALTGTVIILIIGEIAPKTLAINRAEPFALSISPFMYFWHMAILPLRYSIHLFTDSILELIKIPPMDSVTSLTEEELKTLLSTTEINNILEEDEQDMVEGVLELRETTADQVMTPRTDIEAYPIDISREELQNSLLQSEYKRVLIYRETIDNVAGVLHVKDFFLNPDKPLESLLREPLSFPEKMPLISMLAEFRKSRAHLAVVVDEYGGIAGIITLQDVLEEIVWQLEETIEHETPIKKIGTNEFIVDGDTEIWRLNEELEMHLPEEEGARTIAGYMINELERIPERGESLVTDGIKLVVEQRTKRRVTQIRILKQSPAENISED